MVTVLNAPLNVIIVLRVTYLAFIAAVRIAKIGCMNTRGPRKGDCSVRNQNSPFWMSEEPYYN